jgi:hypothetical protein
MREQSQRRSERRKQGTVLDLEGRVRSESAEALGQKKQCSYTHDSVA